MRRTTNALMPPPPRSFASWGHRSVIVPPARVESPERIRIGDGVVIHEHVWLAVQRRPGLPEPMLILEDGVWLNRFVKIVCLGSVRLGKRTLISDRAYISDVEYVPGSSAAVPVPRPLTTPNPVVIGEGVFIGVGAIIKPGVTIGDHAYVAAGSIVAKDVPERTLVAGTPARAVKHWDPASG